VQARSNVYAAPFDALAYNGMQVNGSMNVSQEKGTGGTSVAGYIADSWALSIGGTMAVTAGQGVNVSGGPPGLPYQIFITVQTAEPTLGASDGVNIYQPIEGFRVTRLAWGAANAQPISIGFWTAHHRTGTYSVAVRNGAQNRCYVTTYTQNAADVFEYKTITVPGDTVGTWAIDNTVGLYLVFTMAQGSTATTSTLNSWQAGAFSAATGQVNGVAATSDVFRITGVIVLPGIELPSATRAPFIMRPYDRELQLCMRLYEKVTLSAMMSPVAGSTILPYSFKVQKRSSPTMMTVSGPTYSSANSAAINSQTQDMVSLAFNTTAAAGYVTGWVISADARL
jgi:hypothetical protein